MVVFNEVGELEGTGKVEGEGLEERMDMVAGIKGVREG